MQTEFQVICLCAEWCASCRAYRQVFDELAAHFPALKFMWLDIEAEADALGDLDIENFPTLLIKRQNWVLFFGVLLPHQAHLRRLLESFLEQTPAEAAHYANSTVEHSAWQKDADLQRLSCFSLSASKP